MIVKLSLFVFRNGFRKEYKALNKLIFNVLIYLFLIMVRKALNSSTMIYEPIN